MAVKKNQMEENVEKSETLQDNTDSPDYEKLKNELYFEELILKAVEKSFPKIAGKIIQDVDEKLDVIRNTQSKLFEPVPPINQFGGNNPLSNLASNERNVNFHTLNIFKYLLSSCVDFYEQPIKIGQRTKQKSNKKF